MTEVEAKVAGVEARVAEAEVVGIEKAEVEETEDDFGAEGTEVEAGVPDDEIAVSVSEVRVAVAEERVANAGRHRAPCAADRAHEPERG